MENRMKFRLSSYGIISTLTFIFLILTSNPGISIPLFFLIQFVSLYLIINNTNEIKNVKGIIVMVPIIIISLHHFISASHIWGPTNFLAIVFLYSVMFLLLGNNLNLKRINIISFFMSIGNVFEPFLNFIVPVKWISERSKDKEKNVLAKRILLGIAISVPSVLFLILMLSSADMVFKNNFDFFMKWIDDLFKVFNIFKIVVGGFVGLYLFGHLYSAFVEEDNSIYKLFSKGSNLIKQPKGDVIVLNILLASILVIYTIFIAIQFKYLFSTGELPYGLNFAEYARRGFFELVFLSVLNIALILLTTYLLKDKIYVEKNKWALITKLMLIYLCVLTGILLISSFYRMSLYDNAFGFTRLRILVNIFLGFEAAGLVATLVYIVKHNFNILVVYTAIGLAFYMTINIVKIDEIIAEKNIDMYFAKQTESLDMDYLMSLSVDAAPEIIRLLDDNVETITKYKAKTYLKEKNEIFNNSEYNWQSYNLSVEKTKKELLTIKNMLQ